MRFFKAMRNSIFAAAIASVVAAPAFPCTGIRLSAEDGSVVYGRTMEWGAFDLNSRVSVIPRGQEFTGQTPDGVNGRTWTANYGVVALDILEHNWFADGINEAGLAVGLFYHPGFAEYAEFDPAVINNTIASVDVTGYLLTQFASVDEVIEGISDVRVVGVEDVVGFPDTSHWMVTEPSGRSIVIEFAGGETKIFENPLGIITNSPTFDWHLTNLRNYVNLSAFQPKPLNLEGDTLAPIGAGAGMIGLPGDNTPPSRFIRAVAWTQTARPTPDADETVYEALRILDNFNLPLGAAEAPEGYEAETEGMRSSTIWTSTYDLENRVLYFHTQHNRRLRMVDLGTIDFEALDEITYLPLDRQKRQDVESITLP